ncbi:MAG: hypothetical protein K2P88_06995 [Chitinophagaceae bacterium]|uniref:hypothetical protein n=1 Tax=unclassified Paraflavitalea TaxID=2798305 RepID=UPI003D354620|nr:hypothetical protein [Chitinophagaceae bacterium]
MKQLLDNEMPVSPKSPFKWWWFGGVAVLLIGVGLYFGLSNNSQPSLAKLTDKKTQESIPLSSSDGNASASTKELERSNNTSVYKSNTDTKRDAVSPNGLNDVEPNASKENKDLKLLDKKTPTTESAIVSSDKAVLENEKLVSVESKSAVAKEDKLAKNKFESKNSLGYSKTSAKKTTEKSFRSRTTDVVNSNSKTVEDVIEPSSIGPVAATISDVMRAETMVNGNASPKLIPNYTIPNLAATALFKPRSRFKYETDKTKSLRNRVVGTGDHKKYAFGISIPLIMPISDQRALSLNFNAGQNKIGDYLPSVYGQYHLNDKSFLQAEIQVLSPQYIAPTLVNVKRVETGTAQASTLRWIHTYTNAQKLYYFNLPISAYYSPFKNFYLGAGIQFSQMMRGVASVETRSTNPLSSMSGDSLVSFKYVSFGNDSIGSKLNRTDARVLIDANYYWNKFSFGLRYNQSFNNYANLQPGSNYPYTIARNKTLYFYLRYNLFETYYTKKKK